MARGKSALCSLLAGAFIAVAVNEYTTLYAGVLLPRGWPILAVATVMSAMSAVCWLRLSIILAEIDTTLATAPDSINIESAAAKLMESRYFSIRSFAVGAIGFAIVGLGILPIRVLDWGLLRRLIAAE